MPATLSARVLHFQPLAELVDVRDGGANNLDLIRLIAASLVLISHAFPLSGDKNAFEPLVHWTHGQQTFGGLAVCTFFFISGFLVTRSLERRSLIAFAAGRVLRIFPGLAAAVMLCALILGPLVTSSSLAAYFAHPQFGAYFRNIWLQMHYNLPAVFSHNALQAVNGSLWTLEFEVTMYVLLPLVLLSARMVSRHLLLAGLVILIALCQFYLQGPATDGYFRYYYVSLGQFFLAGTISYVYRDVIHLNMIAALICIVLQITAAIFGLFQLTYLLAGSYALLWLAYAAPKIKDPITARSDLSYGVYIYAFPMQQFVADRFSWGMTWLGNIVLALPLTYALAALSWRFVERPALEARRTVAVFLDQRTRAVLRWLIPAHPLQNSSRGFGRIAEAVRSLQRADIYMPGGPRAAHSARPLAVDELKKSA